MGIMLSFVIQSQVWFWLVRWRWEVGGGRRYWEWEEADEVNRLFGRARRMWGWRVIRMGVIKSLLGGARLQGALVGTRRMRLEIA
jgi:hypothetical protein